MGMDEEFAEVFQAIGWENFLHINEQGSYLLTLSSFLRWFLSLGGLVSVSSTKSSSALGGILVRVSDFQAVVPWT